MVVPPVVEADLLAEPAELESQGCRQADPVKIPLLDLDRRVLRSLLLLGETGDFEVLFVRDEDLGPGVRIDGGLKGELELPGNGAEVFLSGRHRSLHPDQ
ncbi:MAG TPA: hypothetical protein VE173_09830, partial [Longimicrobiales bacterium]|nr:hypothetical protein [Longimicrobiales bacterium]